MRVQIRRLAMVLGRLLLSEEDPKSLYESIGMLKASLLPTNSFCDTLFYVRRPLFALQDTRMTRG